MSRLRRLVLDAVSRSIERVATVSDFLTVGFGELWAECYPEGVSRVRRLRVTDRIFFVNVNLRPGIRRFVDSEYPLMIQEMERSG